MRQQWISGVPKPRGDRHAPAPSPTREETERRGLLATPASSLPITLVLVTRALTSTLPPLKQPVFLVSMIRVITSVC